MDIKDFIIKKINENSLEESESSNQDVEPRTHKRVDHATFQSYLKNNMNNPELNKELNPRELVGVSTNKNFSITRNLLNLGKLSIIPVTISMLVASMTFLDTPTSSESDRANTINKVVEESPNYAKQTIKIKLNNLQNKQKSLTSISNPNIRVADKIKTEKEKTETEKEKTIKKLKPSSQTIVNLMKNENEDMYKGKDKFSEPFWDVKQWTVGYGTSIEGINSKVKQLEEIEPTKGWVAKFRRIHGNIPAHPDDLEPGVNKKFPLGRVSHNTSLAALEYFHKKNSERLEKEYNFIEIMPENVKEAIYDMSFNMGGNFFSKFVKFKKNLEIAGKLLKKLKTQRLSSKEKLKLEKRINIYFIKATKEIIDSDYFRESHVKRKNKILEKQKEKQKEKKSFRYPKKYIEVSRPYKMIMLVIQGSQKTLSPKKEKHAKKLINDAYKKYKNEVNESLLVSYIKQIILS
tara:strand:- start:8486 stop:9871 length:1386 start_codon:yes stop_codon:yes gene_type:complete